MRRLQTIPGVGRDDTATPEGLDKFLNRAAVSVCVASRIVELGPLLLKFVFKAGGSYDGTALLMEWEWQDDVPFGKKTVEGVPPYWQLVFDGAMEVGDADWGDRDFPEKLDQAIQNSTRDELYRVGLRNALDDATRGLRNAMQYRNYCWPSAADNTPLTGDRLSRALRVQRNEARGYVVAIRTLRGLLEATK